MRLFEGDSNPQPSEQVFKTWDIKCLALIAQMVREFRMNPKVNWGFESPSDRDIFWLINFDTFTRTFVRVSQMNAVARAQLTFHMLTFLQKYLYRQSQYSKTSQWTILGSEYVTKASCAKTWKGRLDHVKTVTFWRRQRRFEIVCKAFAQIDENQ